MNENKVDDLGALGLKVLGAAGRDPRRRSAKERPRTGRQLMGMNELEKYGIAGVAVVIVIIFLISLGSGIPTSPEVEVPLPGLAADLSGGGPKPPAPAATTPQPGAPREAIAGRGTQAGHETSGACVVPSGREPQREVQARVVEAVETPPATAPGARSYRVQARDTLWVIAMRELGSSARWREILQANPGLDPRRLKAGITIILPGAPPESPLSTVARTALPARELVSSLPGSYVVRRGDSLERIAAKLYGKRALWRRIYQANKDGLRDPHKLKVGQTLAVPRLDSAAQVAM
ncbi:MAG: LysM peptidoglycan-binding domain-containing protein [Planctomycetota bacterium]